MKTIKTFLPALLGISVVLSAVWSMHIAYAVDTPDVTCVPAEEQVVAVVERDEPVPVPEVPLKPIAKPAPVVAPTPQPVAPPAPIAQPVAPAPVSIAAKPAPVVKQKAPVVVKKSRRTRAS